MYLEHFDSPFERRTVDRDVPVETTWPEQCRIKHVRPVRGRNDDDRIGLGKPVHFAENLIERLLALVVTTAKSRTSLATDGVNFIDEDDRRRRFLGLLEQIADATRPHANEHLDELRAAHGKKGHPRLASNSPRQEGLARPGRPVEQHALWDTATEPLESIGILEIIDDFL